MGHSHRATIPLNRRRSPVIGQTCAVATIVYVHAHPDDEALLTGGSIAHLARAGHRVVLVTATDGQAGLAASDIQAGGLGAVRTSELARSCEALGVAAFHSLGYADSGLDGQAHSIGKIRFVGADPQQAGRKLADILDQEAADIVVSYDASGGYGHPDHVQVHVICEVAVQLRPTPLIESTIPREPILAGVKSLYAMRWLVPALKGLDMELWNHAYTPKTDIVYRLDVSDDMDAKRAALAAHASQATADDGPRTISVLLRLPKPVFRMLMGREWFAAPGRSGWTPQQELLVNSVFGQPRNS